MTNTTDRREAFIAAVKRIDPSARNTTLSRIVDSGASPTAEEFEELSVELDSWLTVQEDAWRDAESRVTDAVDAGEYDADDHTEAYEDSIRAEELVGEGRKIQALLSGYLLET